jgi:hypothetical protein
MESFHPAKEKRKILIILWKPIKILAVITKITILDLNFSEYDLFEL